MIPLRARLLLHVLLLSTGTVLAGGALADAAAANRFYEDGLRRFERRDLAGAVIQLRNALQQDRTLPAAHLLLARTHFRAGEFGPAERAFNEALRHGIDRSEVAVALAGIYLAQGKAAKVVQEVAADGLPVRQRMEVLALRGLAYAQLGKPAEARASFARARELDPASPVPLIAEVPVRLAGGEPEQARELAARAIQLAPANPSAWNAQASVAHAGAALDDALRDYGRALELDPGLVDARIARAAVLVDLGRDDDAGRDLERLAADAPTEPRAAYLRALLAGRSGDGRATAEHLAAAARAIEALPADWVTAQEQILMLGALVHHAQGQLQNARSFLDRLIRRHPRNTGALKLMASIEIDANNPVRAIAMLDDALRLQPDDAQAQYLMGRALIARKRYLQATEYLERASASGAGGDPRLQASLGLGQIGLGQPRRGMRNLEDAFARAPGDLGLGIYLAGLHLGRGETAKALQVAQALSAALPSDIAARNLLGVVQAANGDRAGARRSYQEALKKDGGFAPARLNLARLDVAEGRHADARGALHAMLAANRDDAVAMYELGLLERDAGRPGEALRWLEKAAAARPRDLKFAQALVGVLQDAGAFAAALDRAKELAARRSGDADTLELVGLAQLHAGETQAARQTFREMSRLAAFDPAAQLRVGYLQLAAGSPEDAAYSSHKILSGDPDDAGALRLSAEAAVARGDPKAADEHMRRLRASDPARVEALRLAGEQRTIESAYLGWWSGSGLGVGNRDAGPNPYKAPHEGRSAGHAMDNGQRYDSVLLGFADVVKLESLTLGGFRTDPGGGVMARAGSAGAPPQAGRPYQSPASHGWQLIGRQSSVGSGSPQGVEPANAVSSCWLIGAFNPPVGTDTGWTRGSDFARLASARDSIAPLPPGGNAVAEPGSLLLAALGIAGLMGWRRRAA